MKKVLLLAAAVLTLGTATAHLGLNGTFGKPVSKALHKAFEAVKLNPQEVREATAGKAVFVGYTDDAKTLKAARPMVNSLATPMAQMFTAEKLTVSPAKAAIAKQLAAKAPAAMSQTYTGNCQYYSGGKWNVAQPWTMKTISAGGADYMFDVIPDLAGFGAQMSAYADGVFVQYTSTDNGDGTTAISIAPQYIASTAQYDIFLIDRSNANKGGDGSIKMTLAADGKLTVDNPTNIVGYFATPINTETPEGEEPPFVAANVAGAFEQTGLITYSIPAPDTFVAETTYTGKGNDISYDRDNNKIETPATWEMKMGKKDGVAVIRDLVPSVSEDTGVPTDVTYTENGNTITIQPQKVGMYNAYYLYIFDWDSTDGSITLTKDAQGHIITPENLAIVIGAFATDAFSGVSSSNDDYLGFWTRTEKVAYYAEGQEIPVPAPTVMYEPASVPMSVAISDKGYIKNNSISFVPGYAEIAYTNTTSDVATAWSWEVCDSVFNGTDDKYEAGANKVTGTGRNFSFMTAGSATFGNPTLIATNEDKVSAPYIWAGAERKTYMNVGGTIDSYGDDASGSFMASVAERENGFVSYTNFGTPDKANNSGITSIYMYQGKPAAPLYFTGLNLLVRNFAPKADFNLTARIVEATRRANGSVSFGKTIAYVDASEAVQLPAPNEAMYMLYFNDMYVLDEDEMSQTIDHIFMDKEFAVVIDGWDNETFSADGIFLEDNETANANGFYNMFFEKATEPGSLYRFNNMWSRVFLGFNEAAYGYLHTADNTDFTAFAAGGEATIRVDDALFSSINASNERSPRVFLSDDCPEWVTVSVANANEDAKAFDLKFTFAENDGEARKASFYVWQEGAKIDVTVDQAGSVNTGISGISADNASANAPRYNVAGQRVNASAKGIVISNGRKQIAK
ncbi:MAG: hypothetical protein K2H16_07030 [Prevotella sp.]|nr:hypothetical protein [Prevotella sp.]